MSRALRVLAIAAVYCVAARVGLSLAFATEQVTTVWPPTGIAFAALILGGSRLWPGIWLGAFLINTTAHEPLLVAAGIATGNTLEALAGAWVFARAAGPERSIGTVRGVMALVVLVAGLSTVVAATIGTVSLCLGGVHPWSRFSSQWLTWWLGDAMGDVVAGSVLLAWTARPRGEFTLQKFGEFAGLAACTLLASLVVYSGWVPSRSTIRSRMSFFRCSCGARSGSARRAPRSSASWSRPWRLSPRSTASVRSRSRTLKRA